MRSGIKKFKGKYSKGKLSVTLRLKRSLNPYIDLSTHDFWFYVKRFNVAKPLAREFCWWQSVRP